MVSEYATAYVKLRLGDGHGADAERDGVERACTLGYVEYPTLTEVGADAEREGVVSIRH